MVVNVKVAKNEMQMWEVRYSVPGRARYRMIFRDKAGLDAFLKALKSVE